MSPQTNAAGKPIPKSNAAASASRQTTNTFYFPPFSHSDLTSVSRIDMGVDYCFRAGAPLNAIGRCKINIAGTNSGWPGAGGFICYTLLEGPLAGQSVYWAEDLVAHATPGKIVEGGKQIATATGGGTCTEIGWATSSGSTLASAQGNVPGSHDNTAEGHDFSDFLAWLGLPPGQVTGPLYEAGAKLATQPFHTHRASLGAPGTGTGTGTAPGTAPGVVSGGAASTGFQPSDLFAVGRAAAFSTQIDLPGLLQAAESRYFKGPIRSVYNDQALLPFIQQLCQGSLRQFQSLPNGAFFAFFPDYFGAYGHRSPYWAVEDIEIVDGGITLSDESLITHEFVAGDTHHAFGGEQPLEPASLLDTKGVISVYDAFATNFFAQQEIMPAEGPTGLQGFGNAVKFLERYGVRPNIEEAPFIRSPWMEIFYALNQFLYAWANQFRTTFSFTFMPELYPGGIVAFPNHGFQAFIDSVTHTFDYVNGFTTEANLSAPSAYGDGAVNVSQGMVQPFLAGIPQTTSTATTGTTPKMSRTSTTTGRPNQNPFESHPGFTQ